MELQYDGTGLHGWAKQNGLLTVEGSLEKALATVLGEAPTLRVAGRTDAGVHARRQVASLLVPAGTDLGRLAVSLNALTPEGISVDRLVKAPNGFDARRDAISRSYRYFISTARTPSPFWSPYCWRVGHSLAKSVLDAAAELTVGRHDFRAFTPVETKHSYFVRTVKHCAWTRVPGEEDMLRLDIEADAFLRHMVRTLVGTMVEVAEGKRDLDSYQTLLTGAGRVAAGLTAPAHGLFLWGVTYGARREGHDRGRMADGVGHADGADWADEIDHMDEADE